ncbi:hypothetical protein JXA85_07710 [Candidatus Woesearchaeota archaeon]|nr:hypothetical protein [Candidatus Woesearchaeota archaeon]
MFAKRKSQAAMEFLMTYGWAILVVLIVIGALAYFGVLSPTQFLPRRCSFTQGLTCTDHLLSKTGGFKVMVTNGIGNDITLNAVSLNSSDGTIWCASGGTAKIVAAGDVGDITSGTCQGTGWSSAKIGKRVKGTIILSYVDSVTGFGHNITGSLLTDIEP